MYEFYFGIKEDTGINYQGKKISTIIRQQTYIAAGL
jgi:hypothetical protein